MAAELRFDGMVALVTGGAGGLGSEHVRQLVRRGAKVMINDVGERDGRNAAEALAETLAAEGHDIAADPGNVGDEAAARGMVEATIRRFGRIDLLVNNAGDSGRYTVQDIPTAEMRRMIDVHLMGAFWTTQAALGPMREQGFGRIVNTTSALGIFGAPQSAAYTTVKAALVGLTKATALDNADVDIKANALAPVAYTPLAAGYFATQPHIDVAKLDAANVSPAVLFLLSRECNLSGEMIAVGGGRIARPFVAVGPGYRPGRLDPEAIVDNLETMLSTDGFELLKSSIEQYRFL